MKVDMKEYGLKRAYNRVLFRVHVSISLFINRIINHFFNNNNLKLVYIDPVYDDHKKDMIPVKKKGLLYYSFTQNEIHYYNELLKIKNEEERVLNNNKKEINDHYDLEKISEKEMDSLLNL